MGAVQDAIEEKSISQNQLEARLSPASFKNKILGHLPGASCVETGVGALFSGGLCCTDGGTCPCKVDGGN